MIRLSKPIALLLLVLSITFASTLGVSADSGQEASPDALPYRIQAGDILGIVVYGQPDLSFDAPVMADGTISYPFGPVISVKGLTASEVAAQLESILMDVVRSPVVSVSIKRGQGPYVVVLGEIHNPGIFPITGEQTYLLEAIALAGGTTAAADLTGVKVFERGSVREYSEAPIGAERTLFEGPAATNPSVHSGSIIYVPTLATGAEVMVLGEVRSPGVYPLEAGREVSLLTLIARAGGTTPEADLNKVRVYAEGQTIDGFEEAPIGTEGLLFEGGVVNNPRIHTGNIIYVPPRLDAQDEIFVLGAVRSPGSYPVEAGRQIRLIDVIARAGGTTPEADLAQVKVYERGDIRDYREAPIGAEGVLFEGGLADNPFVSGGNIIYVPSGLFEVTVMGLVQRPGAYEVKAGTRLLDLLAIAGGLLPDADETNLLLRRDSINSEVERIHVDLPKVLTGEAGHTNIPLRQGDLLFVQPAIQVAVAGEVRNNAVFRLSSNSRVTDAILAAGGVTSDADLSRMTISRNESGRQVAIPVDYEGILSGKAENVALFDGDIIHVPGADRYVFVVGEVANPGMYRVRPDSRLIEIIYTAGGPTREGNIGAVSIFDPIDSPSEADGVEVEDSGDTGDGVPTATFTLSPGMTQGKPVFVGGLEQNPPVRAGQTIYVPKHTMEVFVLGDVSSPGRVQVATGSRLLDVVIALGGPRSEGDWRAVKILRSGSSGQSTETVDVIKLLDSPESDENVVMYAGDALYIPPNVARVSVLGEVARPGTYAIPRDSKLVDVVAAAGGAGSGAALERVNVMQESEAYQPVEVRLGVRDEFSLEGLEDSLRVQDGDVVVVPKSHRLTWTEVITILTGIKLIKDLLE